MSNSGKKSIKPEQDSADPSDTPSDAPGIEAVGELQVRHHQSHSEVDVTWEVPQFLNLLLGGGAEGLHSRPFTVKEGDEASSSVALVSHDDDMRAFYVLFSCPQPQQEPGLRVQCDAAVKAADGIYKSPEALLPQLLVRKGGRLQHYFRFSVATTERKGLQALEGDLTVRIHLKEGEMPRETASPGVVKMYPPFHVLRAEAEKRSESPESGTESARGPAENAYCD